MTVSVAGRLILEPAALSALGRLSLSFVDGGPQWLAWAIGEPAARYEFEDETALLASVQQGLHASRYALLPSLGLQVSPVKLMTLGLPDLRTLAAAETGDANPVVAAQLRRVLSDHRLLVAADLAPVHEWLAQLGVAASPLFQAPALDDLLALHALMCEQPAGDDATGALAAEAAAFAAREARTPSEFCDFHRVYLDRTASLAQGSPAQRADAAGAALQALLPLMFGALDCPQVDGLPAPKVVGLAVADWLQRGRQVGFARLSLAVQQCVRHGGYAGETGDAAKAVVRHYLQAAQTFLASQQPVAGRLGQDGATCDFALVAGPQQALLQVGPSGVVALREFAPSAAMRPSTPTTPPETATPPAAPAAIATSSLPASRPPAASTPAGAGQETPT